MAKDVIIFQMVAVWVRAPTCYLLTLARAVLVPHTISALTRTLWYGVTCRIPVQLKDRVYLAQDGTEGLPSSLGVLRSWMLGASYPPA